MNTHHYDDQQRSNLRPEHRPLYRERPYNERQNLGNLKPRIAPEVLDSSKLVIEKKEFTISRNRNAAGDYIRVEEYHANFLRKNSIVIPAEGIAEFIRVLQSVSTPPAK